MRAPRGVCGRTAVSGCRKNIVHSFDEGVSCGCLQMLEKGAKRNPKKTKRESKGAKKEPKGVKWKQKEALEETKSVPNAYKNLYSKKI